VPIEKEEWDAGRTWETDEARVLAFLTKNRGKAFTSSEIVHGLGYITEIMDFWSLLGASAVF